MALTVKTYDNEKTAELKTGQTISDNGAGKEKLMELLDKRVPPLHLIRAELLHIHPARLAWILGNNPELVFFIDYYFRIFEPEIGAKIISHFAFPVEFAADLFKCQILRAYQANLRNANADLKDARIMDSYWALVSQNKLLQLFEFLHRRDEGSKAYAILIFRKLKYEEIAQLLEHQEIKSSMLLDLFKQIGPDIKDMIAGDFDLFDVVFQLASELKDTGYLEFLEEYITLTVRMRIAQSRGEVAKNYIDQDGTLPLPQLIQILRDIPLEYMGTTLNYFIQKKYITPAIKNEILDLMQKPNAHTGKITKV